MFSKDSQLQFQYSYFQNRKGYDIMSLLKEVIGF